MSKASESFLKVDVERCMGCLACEMACAVAHTRSGTLFGAVLGAEPLAPRNHVVAVAGVRFPTQCRQCEEAPCVKVCPTGATFRTETYTAVNTSLCIACKLCMMVCPFGAIQIATVPNNGAAKRAAIKCDLCEGVAGGPACVRSCPTHAITIAEPRAEMKASVQVTAARYLQAIKAQSKLSES